ncbi:MAG: AraC family transcriptional regulator [Chthoniobacteraceae bacterium]|nr:AraC family transcriptional regulator [Chthoniobacteraceae bacterium]
MNPPTKRAPVVFGDVVYPPGGVCGPRTQRDYQLVAIHQGWLDLRLDGEEIAVAPGQAILLAPKHREHFLFSRTAETRHTWCSVDPACVPAPMRRAFPKAARPAPFDSRLAALLKLGLSNGAPAGPLENNHSLALGLALLSGFVLALQRGKPAADPGGDALARMESFVSREYAKPLKLAHLAAAAGVSRQHLMKLFRERGWPTPTAYLYGKRLETAADLLAHTGLAVGEIADRCGFVNPFHFSRKFRQTYGKSPRAWRANAWGGKGMGKRKASL